MTTACASVSSNFQSIAPSLLKVVMMTVTGQTGQTGADDTWGHEKLVASLNDADAEGSLSVRKVVQTDRMRRPRGSFGNSTALQYRGENDAQNMCVKVFNNAVLHVAGCKTIDDFIVASSAAARVCKTTLVDFSINLINLQFYLNGEPDKSKSLDLDVLAEDLRSRMATDRRVEDVIYNPDRFPGLRIKMRSEDGAPLRKRKRGPPTVDKGATIMLFRNSCVKIAGVRDFAAAAIPYEFITSVVDSQWAKLTT